MANSRFVAYYRVSTDKQGKSGLGLQAQVEAVRKHLNGGEWSLAAEFTEVESGKDNGRPELHKAIRAAKLYRAKLIIAKLDRLTRNVAFVSNLMESGVEFIAVDFPQANRLTIHILAAVAEHEASMISQRTKAALGAAKARGTKLGGNRGAVIDDEARKASVAVRSAKAKDRATHILPIIEELKASGITSLGAVARELTVRRVPTSRGLTTWTSAGVSRVLEKAAT